MMKTERAKMNATEKKALSLGETLSALSSAFSPSPFSPPFPQAKSQASFMPSTTLTPLIPFTALAPPLARSPILPFISTSLPVAMSLSMMSE